MAVNILEIVAATYGVTTEDIQSVSQKEPLPEARKMIVYIMNQRGEGPRIMAKAINRSTNYVYRVCEAIEPEIKIYKATKFKYRQILNALAHHEEHLKQEQKL